MRTDGCLLRLSAKLVKHQNQNQTAVESSIRNLQSHVLGVEQRTSQATAAATAASRATQELAQQLEQMRSPQSPEPPTPSSMRSSAAPSPSLKELEGLNPNDPGVMDVMRASGVSPWGDVTPSMAPLYPQEDSPRREAPGTNVPQHEMSFPRSIVEGTGLQSKAAKPAGPGAQPLPPPVILPAIGGSLLKGPPIPLAPGAGTGPPKASPTPLGPNQQRTFINFPAKGRA